METNTTSLIKHWNMAGAGDLDGCFGSSPSMQAPVRHEEPTPVVAGDVLLKPAGEEEWLPLPLGGDPA